MYTRLQLVTKFIRYYLTASSGKGHGIHSPFVFDFISTILNDHKNYEAYGKVEALRNKLTRNPDWVTITDLGSGKLAGSEYRRRVSEIASRSLKSPKYGKLLYRIAKRYFPESGPHQHLFLELGTSLGLTTSYLAMANSGARVISLEGAPGIADVARKNFINLGTFRIDLIEGNFDETLPRLLQKTPTVDLAFIDGNHNESATLRYFDWLLPKKAKNSIFIFDDIHWSEDMESAWKSIQNHPSVTLSIDLFFIGIVFFNDDFKVKQDFTLRF